MIPKYPRSHGQKFKATLCFVTVCFSMILSNAGFAAETFLNLLDSKAQLMTSDQKDFVNKILKRPLTKGVHILSINQAILLKEDSILIQFKQGVATAFKTALSTKSGSFSEDYSWSGKFENESGNIILVSNKGEITGTIWYEDKIYNITPLGRGLNVVVEINPFNFPPDDAPGADQGGALHAPSSSTSPLLKDQATSPSLTATSITTVNVLVPYTAAAKTAVGGKSKITSLAQSAINAANQAYQNSNINITLNLVGTLEVSYSESTYANALNDMSGCKNGMKSVCDARSSLKADLVALLVNMNSYCGMASAIKATASSAFAAVYYDCAVGYYSLAHELGHLFGARHDPYVDSKTSPYPYGHGYVHGMSWRTIMAYGNACAGCTRQGFFSNPSVLYKNVPTGTVDVNDNARVHNGRALEVSAFQ